MKDTTDSNSRSRQDLTARILIGLCLLALTSPGQGERFKKRGVSISDPAQMYVSGVTTISGTETGAALTLPLDAHESWTLLQRVLSSLGVDNVNREEAQQQLVTEWILWTYDSDSDTGSSKPPLKTFSRSYERHRFRFNVSADKAESGAIIHISDIARQREVDITPDSEYAWLEWKDFPSQPGAAVTFLRRLQGNFEAAMVSRMVAATIAAPRSVESVQSSGGAGRIQATGLAVTESEATPGPATASVQSTPAPRPTVPPPAVEAPAQPEKAAKPPRRLTVTPSSPAPAESGLEAATVSAETRIRPGRPPAAPVAVQGGLLVDAGRQRTWQALSAELDSLGVSLQTSDGGQYMLTTEWIDSSYEKKNQQFIIRSKDEAGWAFNWSGKGRQRHRFQLMLIPVDSGTRTMIYAYHTGFQEETDQTPDSSQTLLYWQDRKTEPHIAMAFLGSLRIVVDR